VTKQNQFGGKTNPRRDRLIQEERHDTYRAREKPPEPTRCPDCRAVFRDGRWTWTGEDLTDSHERTCPACQRIRDAYPAGYVTLSGSFLGTHRDEIENLISNEEKKETEEHPLKRIMDVKGTDEGLLVTTTDSHLARSIGEAVARAYAGKLDYHYTEDDMLRVVWKRDV
jgi:NMD protein affecting ribosome stability and mRNA decay